MSTRPSKGGLRNEALHHCDILLAGRCGTAAITQKVKETTLPSGWRVDCVENHTRAEKRCFAGTFGKVAGGTAPFQVYYVNKTGPIIMAGHHTHPSMPNTVCVDNMTPRRADKVEQHKAIVADLLKGRSVSAEFYTWPRGFPQTMTIDLTRFPEAYALLETKRVH